MRHAIGPTLLWLCLAGCGAPEVSAAIDIQPRTATPRADGTATLEAVVCLDLSEVGHDDRVGPLSVRATVTRAAFLTDAGQLDRRTLTLTESSAEAEVYCEAPMLQLTAPFVVVAADEPTSFVIEAAGLAERVVVSFGPVPPPPTPPAATELWVCPPALETSESGGRTLSAVACVTGSGSDVTELPLTVLAPDGIGLLETQPPIVEPSIRGACTCGPVARTDGPGVGHARVVVMLPESVQQTQVLVRSGELDARVDVRRTP